MSALKEEQEDDESDDNIYELSTPDEGDQLSYVAQRVLFTPTIDAYLKETLFLEQVA